MTKSYNWNGNLISKKINISKEETLINCCFLLDLSHPYIRGPMSAKACHETYYFLTLIND